MMPVTVATAGLPPRAIFLDVGGTLLTANPSVGSVYAEVLAGFGRNLDPLHLERQFHVCWAHARRPGVDRFAAAGGASGFWRSQIEATLAGVGDPVKLRDAEFEAVYEAFRDPARYRLYPEVIEVLEALARRRLRLGVISNWDGRLPELLAGLGLEKYFEVTIVSGIEGAEKPAPELYAEACRRARVRPEEALHVGDSEPDDYEGALGASLGALLLDRGGKRRGRHVVHDLRGVLAHVA